MNPLGRIIGYLAPFVCLDCGDEGLLLCSWCRSSLSHVQSRCYRCLTPSSKGKVCIACHDTLTATLARTSYDQILVRKMLFKLKSDRAGSVAIEMAEMMAPLLRQTDPTSIVTYAPTSTRRVRSRGYDQAQLIARYLSRSSGLPYRRLLARVGHTRQVGADHQSRQNQLISAFRVISPGHITGRSIIIVDDVMTTGATLETAARVLVEAGATQVTAVVFAAAQKLL
ncbi:MAG: ComFC, amidophosphoribosyltransferase [Candidatus Saccharibacteria bacterium]|nr:ComFC, amidophosphoribosyltransferase [Candidatus Saccharibacteria bacterium]